MASQPTDIAADPTDRGVESSDITPEAVRNCYRTQVIARTFDEKAVNLHAQGRIGTYAPLKGQEAAQVGAAAAIEPDDVCFPTYRDHAVYLSRGFDMEDLLLHLLGEGNMVDTCGRPAEDITTFPPTIPIATQLPHAVGAGMAADYRDEDRIALVSFGDGATSEGDFHEAMNFAGVFDAPVVFLCQNNGYAISQPVDRQTATDTLAKKAEAYGFEGVRVDGNDLLAVYEAVSDAAGRARAGEGPTMVEAVTYRRGPHTTTDDPERYRDEEEVEAWADHDPIDRTREFLERTLDWSEADDRRLREDAEETVAEAVAAAERRSGIDVDTIFEHVFETPTDRQRRQHDRLADLEDAVDG